MPTPRTFLIRRLLALATIAACAVALWFLLSLFQPFAGGGHGRVRVTIPPDTGASEVGSILERDGVISSSFFFKLRAALDGDRGKLHAGTYDLKLGMSYGAALQALISAPPPASSVSVVVIPGLSRAQLQAKLASEGIKNEYVQDTLRSKLLNPHAYGAPRKLPSLEGFLWPDTYDLAKPIKVKVLIADQLERFKQEFATVNLSYAHSKNLTAYDVLKIASLISEESMLPRDAPDTASVIYNRLRLNMTLGLDSTVSYATGNYGTLSQADLNSPSPWNTTNHRGLPPTPIDSPDMAAIQAAAHPSKSDYLYFINKVCGDGALRFTADYNQFQGWSNAWNTAVAHAGGDIAKAEFCGKAK